VALCVVEKEKPRILRGFSCILVVRGLRPRPLDDGGLASLSFLVSPHGAVKNNLAPPTISRRLLGEPHEPLDDASLCSSALAAIDQGPVKVTARLASPEIRRFSLYAPGDSRYRADAADPTGG
jgi:hypothetical protein